MANDILEFISNRSNRAVYKGPVLSYEGRAEIMELIDTWANSFYEIEQKYVVDGNCFDRKDDATYAQMGESICYLNDLNSVIAAKINSALISMYDEQLKKVEDKKFLKHDNDECNEYKKVDKHEMLAVSLRNTTRYLKFFNNLSASKIKYVFFKERPVKSLNYPVLSLGKKFADIAYELADYLSENNLSISKLNGLVANYCLFQELMYSFVYRQDKQYGVFLRFGFDFTAYEEISKRIKACAKENLVEGKNLKYFFVRIGYILFDYYVDGKEVESKSDEELLSEKMLSFTRFYELFVLKKGSLFIEPITYQLYDIMWKVHGMIDITDKSVLHKRYHDKRLCIEKRLGEFVVSYLKNGYEVYASDDDISYEALYKMGGKLFGSLDFKGGIYNAGIHNLIFKEPNIDDINERMKELASVGGTKRTVDFKVNGDAEHNIEEGMFFSHEDDCKLNKIISSQGADDILRLFYNFSELIGLQKQSVKGDESIVGFYKAGVFLGHMMNIFSDIAKRKNIWLFNTRPYVATHPIHSERSLGEIRNTILVDDSIKTGFTSSLYKSYVKRNVADGLGMVNVKLFTLFDYRYYKRLNVITENDYYSLFEFLDKEERLFCRSNYKIKEVPKLTFQYIEKEVGSMLTSILDKDGDVDLSFFLTDTNALLSICFNFIDEIIKRRNESGGEKKIILYSPTPNGEVLMLMCLFLLKTVRSVGAEVAGSNVKKEDDLFVVAIDLSLVTGFTIMYNWKIFTDKNYDMREDDVKQLKEYFDMIAVVYCSRHECCQRECSRCGDFVYSLNPK